VVLVLAVVTLLLAMLATWAGAIVRVALGYSLLPPTKPRTVPWGVGSVLLLIVLYIVLSIGASILYAKYTGRGRFARLPAKPLAGAPNAKANEGPKKIVPARANPQLDRKAGDDAKKGIAARAHDNAEQKVQDVAAKVLGAAPENEAPARADLPAAAATAAAKKAAGTEIEPFEPSDQLLLMSVVNGLILVLAPLLLRATSRATLGDLGLSPARSLRYLVWGVLACFLLAPLVYAINIPLSLVVKGEPHPLLKMLLDDSTGRLATLALVSAVFFAPAAEELFFRGILLGWLLKVWGHDDIESTRHVGVKDSARDPFSPVNEQLDQFTAQEMADEKERPFWLPQIPRVVSRFLFESRFGRLLPNVITSLIFAGLHAAQWPAPIPLFVLSLGLGVLYERTRTLWAPFALHATFNGISTVLLLLAIHSGLPLPRNEVVPEPANRAAGRVSMHARERELFGLRFYFVNLAWRTDSRVVS
jgi:membrane protease YdiL (CAAX protease family)